MSKEQVMKFQQVSMKQNSYTTDQLIFIFFVQPVLIIILTFWLAERKQNTVSNNLLHYSGQTHTLQIISAIICRENGYPDPIHTTYHRKGQRGLQ
jgi:hypothetical protein